MSQTIASNQEEGNPLDLLQSRYLLKEVVGAGAMGVVRRAQDTLLDREVALKELRPMPGVDPAEAMDRFLVEARAAARLAHPNIVGIHDVFRDGERVMIAMEFVSGQTLDRAIQTSGAQPAATVRAIMSQVAQALASAHAAGVVHRDLKPDNIFWTADGRAVVADFGLARIGYGRGTADGTVMGTPGYMAPEQVRGLPVGPQADVFGWGAVAYELASGRPAFGEPMESDPTALAYRIVHEDPEPLSIPQDQGLADLIMSALAKEPDQRPVDGSELIGALAGARPRTIAPRPGGSSIGTRVPGFEIVEQIGTGPAGTVWLARQVSSGRTVALKVFGRHAGTADAGAADAGAAFRDFSTAACSLSGHAIVPVYDAGLTPSGSAWVAMAYMAGGSLRDRLRNGGPLGADDVRGLGAEVAGALAQVHEQGLVHGDVKPGNVLFDATGHVYLSDAGARAMGADVAATYIAPELASGTDPTPSSDLYALGVTLYEAISGAPPFVGSDPAVVLYQHRFEAVPPLSERVPGDLRSTLERVLAKDPAERLPDAPTIAAALTAAAGAAPAAGPDVGYRPTPSFPPFAVSRPSEDGTRSTRNRVLGLPVGALVGMLGAVVLGVLVIVALQLSGSTSGGGVDIQVTPPVAPTTETSASVTTSVTTPEPPQASPEAEAPPTTVAEAIAPEPETTPAPTAPRTTTRAPASPPATSPPATSPPATSPRVTSPPVTSPPVTDPPVVVTTAPTQSNTGANVNVGSRSGSGSTGSVSTGSSGSSGGSTAAGSTSGSGGSGSVAIP